MKNDHSNVRPSERGAVLFYILVAVALFAALSYTVAGMIRSEATTGISDNKAELNASEILDYARSIRQAIQYMRITNGCSDTEIRFINNTTTGYGTSVRNECDVFHPNGGDVNYVPPRDEYGQGTEWIFGDNLNLTNYGNDSSPDLIMVLSDVKQTLCNAINERLNNGFTTPPDETAISTGKFTGTVAGSGAALNCDPSAVCAGIKTACINALNYNGAGQSYVFYQALLPR